MKVIVDPRMRYNYASWYLQGMSNFKIVYDVKPFKSLKYETEEDYISGFAFIVQYDDARTKRVFIEFNDLAIIYTDRYTWCDAYGMVNPKREQMQQYPKICAVGPECGLTLHPMIFTVFNSLWMFFKGKSFSKIPLKYYLRDFLYTNIRRSSLAVYEASTKIKENYVFHASTLWYDSYTNSNTNFYRGEFLKACKLNKLNVEGGLYLLGDRTIVDAFPEYAQYRERYKDFIFEKRISMDDYIKKTKESVVVFNTPSVGGCHGWKLAEYLCMGKAIISMPLSRVLPGKGLIHGENVHFVNSIDDIYNAVKLIASDAAYRQKLEQGARAYYEEFIAPSKVMERLIFN